jgi:hypothetical protein
MQTISHDQIGILIRVTRSLAAKCRMDKPVDYLRELEILTELIKELQADPQYDLPEETPI